MIDMLDTVTSHAVNTESCVITDRSLVDTNGNKNMADANDPDDGDISCIIDHSQDADFVQDNSDYQWFADYSYRLNASVYNNLRTSILSSLCTSYGYNDMARDLDANLAQVDMEDFKAEDMHSLLNGLPQICCTDVHNEKGGEMFASVSGSMMMKYDFDSPISTQSTSHEDSVAGSLYKSEILFSPVKEMPLVNFSIDSLDCEEHDLMLTCQTNMDNYTIAFEGSTIMEKSTDLADNSKHHKNEEANAATETKNCMSQTGKEFFPKLVCSYSPYTTWSKLKEDSDENIHKQNDVKMLFRSTVVPHNVDDSCAFLKSQSLPDLKPLRKRCITNQQMFNSFKLDSVSETGQTNEFVKIYSLPKSKYGRKIYRSVFETGDNFDLISRFIKQKESSHPTVVNEAESIQDGINFADSLASMTDSCSSFSSHSGRLELLKRVDDLEGKELNIHGDKVTCLDMRKYSSTKIVEGVRKRRSTKKQKPIKIMDRSVQTSSSDGDVYSPAVQTEDSNTNQPVFVMYPNYTLPDLTFLQDHGSEIDLKNVFLWPQKFSPSPTTEHAPAFGRPVEPEIPKKKRPCSCPDLESIKKRDYEHIEDWKSLMFLLPREYGEALLQEPRLRGRITVDELGRSLICTSYLTQTDAQPDSRPSSGFRGSSAMLESDELREQRPPLPKGILRHPVVRSIKKRNSVPTKRCSMFELRHGQKSSNEKRRSLPTQFTSTQQPRRTTEKDSCYSEDEGVDSAGSHYDSPGPQSDQDARRLEHLLQTAVHWNEDDIAQLKQQPSRKTVSFADHRSRTPPNSPNTIADVTQQRPLYQTKSRPGFDGTSQEEYASLQRNTCEHVFPENASCTNSYNYKKELIDAVGDAVNRIKAVTDGQDMITYNEENVAQIVVSSLCPSLYAILNHGLKSTIYTAFGDINNSVWQVVETVAQQGPMTRALQELVLKLNNEDVLTEGLLKFNAFIFGLLNVRGLDTWFSYLRTRESVLKKHYSEHSILLSATKGIVTDRQLVDHFFSTLKPLANISFKLDLLFECRQLHRSLMQLQNSNVSSGNNRTSWVLKKIVRSLQTVTGNSKDEECNEENNKPDVIRPRSCADSSNGFTFNDIASTVKKRWSGIQLGSKLASAFDRLAVEEEETYSDSLEHHKVNDCKGSTAEGISNNLMSIISESDMSITENEIYESDKQDDDEEVLPKREIKFKQLQRKWEMLTEQKSPPETNRESFSIKNSGDTCAPTVKSRIPRPVTSPILPPTSLHFTIAPTKRSTQIQKLSPVSPTAVSSISKKSLPESCEGTKATKLKASIPRPSRIDKIVPAPSFAQQTRPSSLPQRIVRNSPKEQSRETDSAKRPSSSGRYKNITTKYVRTLGHRLPSDSGHLSFNDGEKLKVVLEVDDKWILCCRGDQKGLVPRCAVLPISGHF